MRPLLALTILFTFLASAIGLQAVELPTKPAACQPPGRALQCGGPCVVDIETSAPSERQRLKDALDRDNVTVRLGPDVKLDFSDLPTNWFPINVGRCVTLTSVSQIPQQLPPLENARQLPLRPLEQARSPRALGPLLNFGPTRPGAKAFFEVHCRADEMAPDDHVRIAGFRLFGPSFDQQSTSEIGIRVTRCIDIEISNMEIAGWAEQGIKIEDDIGADPPPASNHAGGRISDPSQIVVTGNYIHNNQHPNIDGHAGGYGVAVSAGAWATIQRNAFDFNRHSIEASGDSGGYVARENLVLKGGGFHGEWYKKYTHAFDIHGTGSNGLGGNAGDTFVYDANAFQYRKDNAIEIRGKPRNSVSITDNIFSHPGLENDWGDDAIDLDTSTNVHIGSGNVINHDTYGKYGVCDFDGDGVDDLFLATGATWWFSSMGKFSWTFLARRTEDLQDVRLGYFDDDTRCDVLTQSGTQWVISTGGTGEWRSLGSFGAPLSEVVFGRFDPTIRDHRVGVTLKTTHAFRRNASGQWFVTPLTAPHWSGFQYSSVSLGKMRFGDFTGDGVTDVLAVVDGHWAISESAIKPWRRLNANGDDIRPLFIANLDRDDNVDDLLRLDRTTTPGATGPGTERVDLTWWRSKNGAGPWTKLKSYSFTYAADWETVSPGRAFAGRFGVTPGGGILTTDTVRRGHFYSPAEDAAGSAPDWTSLSAY